MGDLQRGVGSKDRKTTPATTSTTPSAPTTGLRWRGNDTSRNTGRSGRRNAAARRSTRREDCPGPRKETATRRTVTHRGMGAEGGGQEGGHEEVGILQPLAKHHDPPTAHATPDRWSRVIPRLRAALEPHQPLFNYTTGAGGVWGGPRKGRLFKLDFPSAEFWVKILF